MTVPLVVPAEAARAESVTVHGRSALEAGLPETLVQTLAQGPSGDLRMELAAQPAVPVPLERGVWSPSVGEQVRSDRVVREFAPSS